MDEVTSLLTERLVTLSETEVLPDRFYEKPLVYKVLRVIAELVSVVVTVVGNVITVAAVAKCRNLKTITNNFVVSLSLADLLIVPSRVYYCYLLFTDDLLMWKLSVYLRNLPLTTSQGISLYTLLLIAVDRYIAVNHPISYKTTLTRKKSLVMIMLVWFIMTFLSLSVWTFFGLRADDIIFEKKLITQVIPSAIYRFLINPIILFALGTTIILYARIFWVMKKQKARVGQLTATTNDKAKKVTKLMATVLAVLLVCWLPLAIFTATTDPTDRSTHQSIMYIEGVCYFLMYTNSCINPFLYAMKSPEFRKAHRKIFKRFLPKANLDESENGTNFLTLQTHDS